LRIAALAIGAAPAGAVRNLVLATPFAGPRAGRRPAAMLLVRGHIVICILINGLL